MTKRFYNRIMPIILHFKYQVKQIIFNPIQNPAPATDNHLILTKL